MEPTTKQEILELLKDRVLHPAEVAEFMADMEPAEMAPLLASLDEATAADIIEHLDLPIQRELVDHMPRGHMAKLIEEMAPDIRVDLIKELPENVAEGLLPLIARAERLDIAKLVSYEEDTAGSVMTTEYALVNMHDTVSSAREELRRQAPGEQTGYYVYVVDTDRKLVGLVNLRDLLLARPSQIITAIMNRDFPVVHVNDDQETLGDIFSKYELPSVPVVDADGRVVGRITADDVIDVVEEEAEEDIYNLGAAGKPIYYMHSSVLQVARQRMTWLLILVAAGMISSALLQHYQKILDAVKPLAFFIPLLMGSGGNAGSQTTAVVIRGLSTEEIRTSDFWRVLFKEVRVGLIAGLLLGVAAFVRALFIRDNIDHRLLGYTVALAMVIAVTIGKTAGAVLPILFQKMKLDPALMSTPFITTILDILALMAYFNLARWIMF